MSPRRFHFAALLLPLALGACQTGGSSFDSGEAVLSPEERRLQSVEDSVAQLMRRMEAADQAGTSQELTRLLDEVRALRGDVENLRYDLDRATSNQKQLFQNLDQRVATLEGGGSAAAATPGAAPGTLTAVTPASRPATASPEEEGAYLATFDLLKNGRYDDAISGFRSMLERWPEGRYADNAWYWMGEAQYVKRDYASALQSFQSLIQQFPNSPKMPDSLLKAGLAQVELKRSSEARGLFQRVVSEYPNSNAAALARQSLQQLGG